MSDCLLVIQPSVSHYREPLIKELLNEVDGVRFRLVGKRSTPEAAHTSADKVQTASAEVLRLVPELRYLRIGVWVWERSLVVQGLRAPTLVLEGRIFTLSTWLLLLLRRIVGRPTLLWTHGWRTPDTGAKRHVRMAFYRLATGLLVYGPRGRDIAVASGYPLERVAVVGNSIYPQRELGEVRLGSEVRDATLGELGLEPGHPTLITVSRLAARKSIDLLLDAAGKATAKGTSWNLIIIGDGSDRARLEEEASVRNIRAHFAGALYDVDRLRQLYSLADAAICPGAAGLQVVQAFGFGVPVVAHGNDRVNGPETDLIVDGMNGQLFDEGSIESLLDAIDAVLSMRRTDPELPGRCVATVEAWTAEAHARRIAKEVIRLSSSGEQ